MCRYPGRTIAAAVLLLLPGCSAVDDPTAPTAAAVRSEDGVVGAIEISASEAHLELGETQQFQARALDRQGRPLDVPVTWSSSDPRVAMVDRTGLATALSLGLARINVAAQGVMAVAELVTYPVSRIAWRRDGDIWAMNGFGNSQILLATETDPWEPSWSPDGARIAFARSKNIWVMNADGTGQTGLTAAGLDESPRWSPSGAAIAFNRWILENGEPGFTDLWQVSPDGGALTPVTSTFGGAIHSKPTWSPAGGKLAFEKVSSTPTEDIFVVNADGTGLANLTQNAATNDLSPDWSPDGSKIAFHRWPSGQYLVSDIHVMNADGSGQTNLTETLGYAAYEPVWSPDGSRILFENRNTSDLYVMNADGSGVTQLTNTPLTTDNQASWSPDGKRIVFRRQTLEDPSGDICVITADGSKIWNLTNSFSISDGFPVWRP